LYLIPKSCNHETNERGEKTCFTQVYGATFNKPERGKGLRVYS
jgi:hypothetical protein